MRKEAFSYNTDFENKIFDILSGEDVYKNARCIMVYNSINYEAPTKNLIEKMLMEGKRVFVPVTRRNILLAAEIYIDTKYIVGNFNICEPYEIKEISKDELDLILVPGLLFSIRGERCGYGGGYYDRFLENTKAQKIGLAFSKQVIKSFPTDSFDVKMDYILTEKGLINCEK